MFKRIRKNISEDDNYKCYGSVAVIPSVNYNSKGFRRSGFETFFYAQDFKQGLTLKG